MNKHLNIKVTGKVQGVWFRDSTRAEALKLGINGFVRNEPDGSVYIEAEGNSNVLKKFIEWCHSGPEKAIVTGVKVNGAELNNFNEFLIQY